MIYSYVKTVWPVNGLLRSDIAAQSQCFHYKNKVVKVFADDNTGQVIEVSCQQEGSEFPFRVKVLRSMRDYFTFGDMFGEWAE